ncbi:hypothetical protein [Acinetobacter sp. Ac_3412]|uniref:hypothetical protein n=1 Tax=Acinetobacter sp. Ac_3412 TaxID=1848935 RepID=UPI0014903E7A|nr:hypothetical protein [Acinetobacter sp. Ac_3412]
MSDFKEFSKKATHDQSPLLQANEHTQVNTPQPTKPEDSSKPEDSQEPDPNNK